MLSAPRSTQAGAATRNRAAPAPALPILPEAGYGAPPQVGLELHFGSITPEVAAASARRSQRREIRAAGLTPAPPSRDPAVPASSSPATYRSTSTDLTSGAYPEAASTSAQGVGQTGHIGRNCTTKRVPAGANPPPPPPPPRFVGPRQANACAWPALGGPAAPRMVLSPGHPSNRPDEVFSISISMPAMERAATEMRRTHLTIIIPGPRLNISTRSLAKALQDELNFDWEDIQVSASYPYDFLVRFTHPWQRDTALELGSVPLRRGKMALTTWSPTARGWPQTWRFYCRVALENLPLNTWEDEDTVKAVLDGGCELNRIEQRSVLQDNTAALFTWV
ncbi:hypothetical protein QYE76_068666 [Lolium multiflorum]|uniref:Uncharacterized protein n=1 Tax=Lolium multiflorum TaxID=4521 RepID=A0AAD8SG87_LOLMU|nr:hypothetical protein QYE76_068666 [Lolium multiflorum]